jgi:hypothetical protein
MHSKYVYLNCFPQKVHLFKKQFVKKPLGVDKERIKMYPPYSGDTLQQQSLINY